MAPNLSTIMRLDNARPIHVYRVEILEATNAALMEALQAVVMLIEDANKQAPNYRLKMCVAAETALPYLQEAIRKVKGK